MQPRVYELPVLQEPILYVSDPKALHSILIKDEASFQEGKDFLA